MAPLTEDKIMKHRIAETEMHSRGVPEVQPLTWNDTDGVPSSYNDLYYYKTDTVFGVVYGDLEFAIRALRAGVQVTPIFNKI